MRSTSCSAWPTSSIASSRSVLASFSMPQLFSSWLCRRYWLNADCSLASSWLRCCTTSELPFIAYSGDDLERFQSGRGLEPRQEPRGGSAARSIPLTLPPDLGERGRRWLRKRYRTRRLAGGAGRASAIPRPRGSDAYLLII